MTELDFLKQHWNNQENFPTKTKEELRSLIKKKSINTLVWVIIINIFVFSFFSLIGFFSTVEDDFIIINEEVTNFLNFLDYFLLLLPIIFSISYIFILRRIKLKDSVSPLLKNIITAKKILKIYIYSYVIIFIIITYIGVYSTFITEIPYNINKTYFYITLLISCLLLIAITTLLLWLFYKFSYGRLQKKLNENYKILKDL